MAEKTSINDFISHFNTDFARSNLFHVTISEVNLNTPAALEHLKMSCKGVQVPGITFIEGKYILNGFNKKSVIGADLDPITLTFLVDGMGKTLQIFEEWSNKILNKKTGKFGFKENYECDIDIDLLDRAGNNFAIFTLLRAYPTNIDVVDLSWESADTIMEITVSFNFDKMLSSFNGVKPKETKPKPVIFEDKINDVFNMQIPSKADILDKIGLDIPAIPTSADIIDKLPFEIPKIPAVPDIVKEAITIPKPDLVKDVINKTSAVDDMAKKANKFFQ